MKIAITGSSGFIGSYLVKELQKSFDNELILLDLSQGIDICRREAIQDIRADLFIHLANKSFIPDSYLNPYSFYDINIKSTLNMLELSRINNARLIYFSSYVYGTPQYLPMDEKHPVSAYNPYAQSKIICEQLCEGYARDFNVPVTIFRPFNIYGKGQAEHFLIPMMIKQLKESGRIEVKDDRPKRDYVYIQDVINAVFRVIKRVQEEKLEVFNIGSGISYSVKEVAELLFQITGKPLNYYSSGEKRPNEVLDTIADVSKLMKIGWKPEVELCDGLKKML